MSERATPERILVIRIAALGDVVMASTVLQRIRAEAPGAHVTWLCGEGAAPIVRLFDGVHEIITVDERRLLRGGPLERGREIWRVWVALARRRFDRVLLGHPDPRYRILLMPLPGEGVSMFRRGARGHTMPVPGRFAGDEFARLLDPPVSHLGPIAGHWPISNARTRLAPTRVLPPALPGQKSVVLVPGGARNVMRDDALRRWPVDRYASLAALLAAEGHRVALAGDEGDTWVRPRFEGVDVHDFLGKLDLEGTLRLMRDSDLVIAHDTGPMHLARLVRAPLIALFGPTSPRERLVEDETTVALWGGADLACRPCYDGREFASCPANVCIQEITPRAVADRAAALLRQREGRQSPLATPGRVT